MWENLKQNRMFIPFVAGLTVVLVVGLLWSFVFKTPAYSVIIDGQAKFAVADQKQALLVIEKIKKQEAVKKLRDF